MRLTSQTRMRRQRGVLLVEVLVALLLAALAVSALAGAQALGLQASRGQLHRMVAGQLASDLGERLRASRTALALPELVQAYAFLALPGAGDSDPTATLCDGPQAACAPVQFAQADAAQWRTLLRRSLPGGAALVQLDAALSVADIWVAWTDAPQPGDDAVAAASGACPAAFAPGTGSAVRCLHARVAW